MAAKKSAGILLFRFGIAGPEFFLIHPGGPFWKNKDAGAWSIPKGEIAGDESALNAAIREFKEETGTKVEGDFIELNPITQKSGKVIYAWALEGIIDADAIKSNFFEMEWPYKSGKWKSFPEVDKAGWFDEASAIEKINPAQALLIQELLALLAQKN